MSRVILPNLGFEAELSGTPRNKAIERQEARFAYVLRLVSGWETATVFTDGDPPDDALAWGMSAQAAARVGVAAGSWPDPQVVKRVNDKRYSHELARELGVSLDDARIAGSVEEVRACAEAFDAVAKHPFGVAGRGLLRVRTSSDKALRKLLSASEVVVEPWVAIDDEFSGQFDCSDEGAQLVGYTGLLALPNGQFAGNSTRVDVPPSAQDAMQLAADAVWREGYRGPMGIDGYRGRRDDRKVVVPVSEINARWTFGRLALELSRIMGMEVAWHHPPRAEVADAKLSPAVTGKVGRWRLPEHCDPEGRSGTYFEGI